MTSFPGSPRLQKGALIGLDPANPLASMIIFQYNPETISRTLRARTTANNNGDGTGSSPAGEPLRLAGPPEESVRLEVVLDATDQLEKADPITVGLGIHPQLAALEMLLYPKSALVITNEALMQAGVLEVIQPAVPLAILVWGVKRILPVRLAGFSISEEMFDPNLNPIHAKVSLDLNVLSYHDLGLLSPGGALFMAHQLIKEGMATINGARVGLSAAGNFSASFGRSL